MISLTNEQIENLHHTSCASFLYRENETLLSGRFELLDGNIEEKNDSACHMRWYSNQLEALFAFNYFSAKAPTALLWDYAENPEPQYCLRIGSPDPSGSC